MNEQRDVNSVTSESNQLEVREPDTDGLSGLEGWLGLVGIGRVLAPIILLCSIFHTYLPELRSEKLKILSQPGNPVYSSLWKPTILFELYISIFFLIISAILLFLFFGKKKWFPRIFISLAILSVLFSIVDAVLVTKIQSTISIHLNTNPIFQVLKTIVTGAIWIPYMLTSVRVKNTFVK